VISLLLQALLKPAENLKNAARFKPLLHPGRRHREKVSSWRLHTRAELQDIFGAEVHRRMHVTVMIVAQVGLYVAGEPRLCPLPPASVPKALLAICPVGHLTVAQGRYPIDCEVALLDELHGMYVCLTKALPTRKATRILVPCCAVGITYPVIIEHNARHASLSIRYKLAKFNNTQGFEYAFSVHGWN
jgi:hypothetical protein